jgi:hypothetical protein
VNILNLTELFEKVLSFAKESTKTFFIIGGLCIAIIFFSDSLGTELIRDSLNPYPKLTLIVCALGITGNSFQFVAGIIRNKYTSHIRLTNSKRRLSSLTSEEKEILGKYIEFQTRAQSLDTNSGVVYDLKRVGFIFESTEFYDSYGSFSQHNITDWVWDYLNTNPELVHNGLT